MRIEARHPGVTVEQVRDQTPASTSLRAPSAWARAPSRPRDDELADARGRSTPSAGSSALPETAVP